MVSSAIEPPLWTLGYILAAEPTPTTLLGWQAALLSQTNDHLDSEQAQDLTALAQKSTSFIGLCAERPAAFQNQLCRFPGCRKSHPGVT